MKSTIFSDITPYSPLEVSPASRTLPATFFQAGFLLASFFDPEDGGDIFVRNVGLTFNGLYGVMPQRIVLFDFIVVRH
jgi:hypothetical protein